MTTTVLHKITTALDNYRAKHSIAPTIIYLHSEDYADYLEILNTMMSSNADLVAHPLFKGIPVLEVGSTRNDNRLFIHTREVSE